LWLKYLVCLVYGVWRLECASAWCFVVRLRFGVDGLNAKGCRGFRRLQPLVLISNLIVPNWR
jgi:hypothetical protein